MVDFAHKKIISIPVKELWNEFGALPLERQRNLTVNDVRALLQQGVRNFAIADVGCKFEWVNGSNVFAFWKKEVLPRVVDGEISFSPSSTPGGYCYTASLWTGEGFAGGVIVLEKRH